MLSPIETAVLAKNRAFYDAFAARDGDAMAELWAREHDVACTHPGWGSLRGRDGVMRSWRGILGSPEAPKVAFSDAAVIVLGDAAFVTCIEHVGDSQMAATNIFALEQGEWQLVHHQAGPMVPARPSRRPPASPLN